MMYSAETWAVKKAHEKKLDVAEMRMLTLSPLYRPKPPSAASPHTARYRLHRSPLLPAVTGRLAARQNHVPG